MTEEQLQQRLADIASATPWFMRALRAASQLGLASWCLGAGAVRNMVWDHLHGFDVTSHLPDLDLAYFDAVDISQEGERDIQRKLEDICPEFPWEVTNQARVHFWYAQHYGQAVPALHSLSEGISTWPEYATCVGLYIVGGQGEVQGELQDIRVIAPHGLQDLFAMHIRHNPARASLEDYQQRLAQKKFQQRWPRISFSLN